MTAARAYEVVIAGAGPTGLRLAGELALAGVRCKIVEPRAHRSPESRAVALHGRTMELLRTRDLTGAVLDRAHLIRRIWVTPGNAIFNLRRLPSRYGQLTVLPQGETEAVLEDRARALGVTIERGVTLVGCEQRGDEVVYRLSAPDREWEERTSWLVGCDGTESRVRQSMGAAFTGVTYPYSILLADVRLGVPLDEQLLVHVGRAGTAVCADLGTGWHRVGIVDPAQPRSGSVTLDEVREALRGLFDQDLRPSAPRWLARLPVQTRQAEFYRGGRLLIAGDAAHAHPPLGGQGLNLGIQDAMNLGWKLAAVIRGRASERLLDTYARERRQVAEDILTATDAVLRLLTSDARGAHAARWLAVSTLSRFPISHRVAVGQLSGIATRYPEMASDRRSARTVGRRVPDVWVGGDDGVSGRLGAALRSGAFVLIDQGVGERCSLLDPWDDVVVSLRGRVSGGRWPWRRAEIILVRPDGYCAWAGPRARAETELPAAMRRWAGAPTGRARDPRRHRDERDGTGWGADLAVPRAIRSPMTPGRRGPRAAVLGRVMSTLGLWKTWRWGRSIWRAVWTRRSPYRRSPSG